MAPSMSKSRFNIVIWREKSARATKSMIGCVGFIYAFNVIAYGVNLSYAVGDGVVLTNLIQEFVGRGHAVQFSSVVCHHCAVAMYRSHAL